MSSARDRVCEALLRCALRHMSNRASWRAYRIQRQWWSGERGMALIGRLERGEE